MKERASRLTWTNMYASWSYPSWANPHLRPEVVERERERLPPEVFGQEYGAEFIGPGIPKCLTCGYPCRDCPGTITIKGPGEPPKCKDCGRTVNHKGRTLAAMFPDGTIHGGVVLHLRKVPRNVPLSASGKE